MLAVIILLAAATLAAGSAAARLWIERDSLRPKVMVMVNTREGHCIRGMLVKRSRRWVELHQTVVIPQGSDPSRAAPGGVLIIERTEVQWVQVLNG